MTRYIAFLRAINVGGHTVKMDHLCQLFAALGFADVETFIASGNVIFRSAAKNTATLEAKIATHLHTTFGYEVATFIRTQEELARIAARKVFTQARLDAAWAHNVAFLAKPLDAALKRKLMTLKTGIDDFAVHEREVHWLCRKKQNESTFSNAALERALGIQSTLRGENTIRRMAAKYLST
jgi:uncharacterized protein (DUF1697 family)